MMLTTHSFTYRFLKKPTDESDSETEQKPAAINKKARYDKILYKYIPET